jgi:hypothetical protein
MELTRMVGLYDRLSGNPEFRRECQNFNRLDAQTKVGERRTSEAAAAFYLKWTVYPVPIFLLTNRFFRVRLEQHFQRSHRVIWIPVSPVTTEAEVTQEFQGIKRKIRTPRKIPDLEALRRALFWDYLLVHSAWHGFKPSDLAAAMGSRSRKGRHKRITADGETTVELSSKELNASDRLVREFVNRGIPYLAAGRRAIRQITKKRWREAKLTAQIRMSARRARQTLIALLSDPNK